MANLLAPATFQGFQPNNPQQASQALGQFGTGVSNALSSTVSKGFAGAFNNAKGGFNPTGYQPYNPLSPANNTGLGYTNTNLPKPQIVSSLQSPQPTSPVSVAQAAPITPQIAGASSQYSFPPVSSLGSLGNSGSFTLPSGKQVQVDSKGNVVDAPSNFSIDTKNPVPSSALSSNGTSNDLTNLYSDYLQKFAQSYQPTQEYLNAIKQYQDAQLQGASIKANYLTGGAGVPGDTLGFAQGMEGRDTALNALQQMAANNSLNVQQTIRQSNIDASKALVEGAKPTSVGIGTSLVSPANGQSIYQSNYLFKPSAGSINTIAQQLMQQGYDYNTAFNMAQEVVTNAAQGQQGAAGAPADVSQSPVYQNSMSLLQQGVPFDQVLSSIGKTTAAKSMAQQALNDFLGGNSNYNAAAAKAGYGFRQSAGAQTFQVNANTAIENIDKLVNLSNSFPRTQFQITNFAQLQALAQTGNEDAVRLYTYATMLGDDLGKLLGSAAGSDYTTKLGQEMFNPSYSAKQMAAVAKDVKGIIEAKKGFYEKQFSQGTTGSSGSSSASSGGGSIDMGAYAW